MQNSISVFQRTTSTNNTEKEGGFERENCTQIDLSPVCEGKRTNTAPLNIGRTVVYMFDREMKRVSNGHYKKSISETLYVLAIVLTFVSFGGIVIWGSNGIQYYVENWKNLTLLTFLFPIFIIVFLKLSLLMRWFLYWTLITTIAFFIMDSTSKISKQDLSTASAWVLIIFILLEMLTILVYVWIRKIQPWAIIKLSEKDPTKFWTIREDPNQNGHFTCRKYFGFGPKQKFSYVGQLNENMEPHGFGKFTSEWKTGEVLTGLWKDGKPIGPFKAREYSTGYSFQRVRIGFCSADSAKFDKSSTKASIDLRFGVAGVESSATG